MNTLAYISKDILVIVSVLWSPSWLFMMLCLWYIYLVHSSDLPLPPHPHLPLLLLFSPLTLTPLSTPSLLLLYLLFLYIFSDYSDTRLG